MVTTDHTSFDTCQSGVGFEPGTFNTANTLCNMLKTLSTEPGSVDNYYDVFHGSVNHEIHHHCLDHFLWNVLMLFQNCFHI